MIEIETFVRGVVIGFSIAAPVGPIGVLCIRRTIANGRVSGLVSGLGAATADAFYGSLAALGLTFLTAFLVKQQAWLQLVGGIFLCYLGIKTFFEKPAGIERARSEVDGSVIPANQALRARMSDYTSTLFLTLTNPLTILSFTAIFAGIGIARPNDARFQGLQIVAGVFLGSALWWLLLTALAGVFRERFYSEKLLVWINRLSGLLIFGFGVIALAISVPGFLRISGSLAPRSRLVSESSPADIAGYARVDSPIQLQFPVDHGAHPEYLTEWWYFTGNLTAEDGREFGYQLTFFRRSLTPPSQVEERVSDWAANQVYMAHFAVTDVQEGDHQEFEQLSRAAVGLAGSQLLPFRVWLYGWQVTQQSPDTYLLSANVNGVSLELELKDLKGPVLHGEQGYSQKSSASGQASMYYSLTRLASQGVLQIEDQVFAVTGLSWMDHEFSTTALSEDQVGWDWFSIQLEDGTELMVFQIRNQDGSIDPFSSGTFIHQDGTATSLSINEFSIDVQGDWKSPHSLAEYPSGWLLHIFPMNLELEIRPCLADQELNVSYTYWEGCVNVFGKGDSTGILGKGYVELTGYAGSMGGEF